MDLHMDSWIPRFTHGWSARPI